MSKIRLPFLASKIVNHNMLPSLFERASLSYGLTCLEIGCGTGSAFEIIEKHCQPKKLVGIDIDLVVVKKAERLIQKKGLKNFAVKQADAILLPFPDNSFDVVFIFAVLHHISQWQQVLAEAARVLKPHGLFLFWELSQELFQIPIIGPVFKWIDKPEALFNAKELENEIKTNFTIISFHHQGLYKKTPEIFITGVCQKK